MLMLACLCVCTYVCTSIRLYVFTRDWAKLVWSASNSRIGSTLFKRFPSFALLLFFFFRIPCCSLLFVELLWGLEFLTFHAFFFYLTFSHSLLLLSPRWCLFQCNALFSWISELLLLHVFIFNLYAYFLIMHLLTRQPWGGVLKEPWTEDPHVV